MVKKIVERSNYSVSRKKKNDYVDLSLYRKLYSEETIKNKQFFNIGAGSFYHPVWTNVDFESDCYIQNKDFTRKGIQYDLLSLKPIEIKSNSAEIVYSSHTFEHTTDEVVEFVFREIYRILKKGGIFRITTPNIELAYRAFKENDLNYFHQIYRFSSEPTIVNDIEIIKNKKNASIEQLFLFHFASSLSTLHNFGDKKIQDDELRKIFQENDFETSLNYCTSMCDLQIQKKFPGNHINWFNQKKIFKILKSVGFSEVYLSGFGQSISPILRDINYFDNTHPEMSIYVEAKK